MDDYMDYLDVLKAALLKCQGQEVLITRGDATIYSGQAILSKINHTATYFAIKVNYNDFELILPDGDYQVGDIVTVGSKTYKVKPIAKDVIIFRCDGGDSMVKIRIGEI